jgi:hypothetical protein
MLLLKLIQCLKSFFSSKTFETPYQNFRGEPSGFDSNGIIETLRTTSLKLSERHSMDTKN